MLSYMGDIMTVSFAAAPRLSYSICWVGRSFFLPSLFGLLMVWLADAWPLVLVLGLCFDDLFLLRLLLKWFWLMAILRVEANDGFPLLAWCSVFCLLGRNPLG
jgi:hypothetical protein